MRPAPLSRVTLLFSILISSCGPINGAQPSNEGTSPVSTSKNGCGNALASDPSVGLAYTQDNKFLIKATTPSTPAYPSASYSLYISQAENLQPLSANAEVTINYHSLPVIANQPSHIPPVNATRQADGSFAAQINFRGKKKTYELDISIVDGTTQDSSVIDVYIP